MMGFMFVEQSAIKMLIIRGAYVATATIADHDTAEPMGPEE